MCSNRIGLVGKTTLAFETKAGCKRIASVSVTDSESLGKK